MSDHEEDDVLSQDEISDLLAGIDAESGTGETQETETDEEARPSIKIYDFRRPDFLSSSDLSLLSATGEQAESALKRVIPGCSLTSVDVLTLDEYVRAVGNPCVAVPFSYDERRVAVVEVSPRAARVAVDTILGTGVGDRGTEISDFEVAVACEALSGLLPEALSLRGVRPSPARPVTNPSGLRAVGLGSMVCVISYAVDTPPGSGLASLVYDRFTIETLILERANRAGAPAFEPNLVLREVLRFPLEGVTGSDLARCLETSTIDLDERIPGSISYQGE